MKSIKIYNKKEISSLLKNIQDEYKEDSESKIEEFTSVVYPNIENSPIFCGTCLITVDKLHYKSDLHLNNLRKKLMDNYSNSESDSSESESESDSETEEMPVITLKLNKERIIFYKSILIESVSTLSEIKRTLETSMGYYAIFLFRSGYFAGRIYNKVYQYK